MDQPSWVDEIAMAVTVTDAEGRILAMNQRAVRTFAADGGAALVGTNVLDCHPEPARSRLAQMFLTQSANHYTISKCGQRKAIHQLPWYNDGVFAGFVELAIPIGDHLPHFDRD
jgi:transcriptional regulator with PAS, ATPase and Fis domain